MTKRFTIKPSMIVDDVTVIIDNQKEYTFPVLDSTLNYMFCKVLNEQHEQIQRLQESLNYNGAYITAKKKKGAWRNDLIDELRKSNQTKDDYIIEIDTDRKKLLKENEQLKSEYKLLHTQYQDLKKFVENNFNEYLTQEKLNRQIIKLEKENEQLKQVLGSILIEVRRDISATNHSGEVKAFVNPNSFDLISDVLKKYGALKEWYE